MFPERLKELRKQRRLTQKEVGEKVGVSQTAVGFWEKGIKEPGVQTLYRIADLFGVSLDYLTGRSSERYYRKEWIGKDGKTYAAISIDNKNDPTPEEREAVEHAMANDAGEKSKLDDFPDYIRRMIQEELDKRSR